MIVSAIKLWKVYLHFVKRITLINKLVRQYPPLKSPYEEKTVVSYIKFQDINTIRWRLGYIAENVHCSIRHTCTQYRFHNRFVHLLVNKG